MEPTREFSSLQRKILQIIQDSIPDSPSPFACMARQLGVQEQFVLDFLQDLQKNGYIRRFGATLRHQEAGYDCNVMVAWLVEDGRDMDEISTIVSARDEITHCYKRRSCPDWPYNLYTMVHGKSREECLRVVEQISQATGISQYELLFSEGELKKTSMRYF